jgi:NADPH-dependent curcumin reductase CurA
MISVYNVDPSEAPALRNVVQFIAKRITMRGFIVGDSNMGPVYAVEHQKNMQKWLADGSFKAKFAETDGIENAATGFVDMLQGKNFGKAYLRLVDLKKSDHNL